MTEKELQNSDSENEILSAEDEKICRMIGSLKKIGAPKNFDFHLKAKIANAKAEDFQTASLIPFLRYLLPLSVVVLLAVFVGFNLVLNADRSNEIAAETFTPPVVVPSPLTANTSQAMNSFSANAASPPVFAANEKTVAVVVNSTRKEADFEPLAVSTRSSNTLPKTRRDEEEKIQVKDIASKESKVITPPGISANTATQSNTNGTPKSENTAKKFLEFIGVEVIEDNAGWKVTAVSEKNMAFRAGVKVGDIIEAIDDKKLAGEDTTRVQIVGAKVLRVIRDGRKISLEMIK